LARASSLPAFCERAGGPVKRRINVNPFRMPQVAVHGPRVTAAHV
jgi:hypothetical protein